MYDVIIIGAGPAGSTLARELGKRRADLKILMIDGLAEGGSKVCGGLLSPDAQKLLINLGITPPSDILVSPQAKSVDTIDLTAKIKKSYHRDYVNMNRAKFDAYLLSLAKDHAEAVIGRCTGIKKTACGFEVTVNSGGEHRLFSSRLLVGADGASSIVRKILFEKNKIFKYVSIQEWYKDNNESLPDYSCIYDEKTSDSCSWTIRKDGYYIFGGAFAQKGCRQAFAEQKARLEAYFDYKFDTPVKREACLVCSPRKYSDFLTGSDGAYLIGEAAGFISASSFEGISSALLSAVSLAEAIAEAEAYESVTPAYRKRTAKLKLKMLVKIPKMKILCNPTLRKIIIKSGITAKKQ